MLLLSIPDQLLLLVFLMNKKRDLCQNFSVVFLLLSKRKDFPEKNRKEKKNFTTTIDESKIQYL